MDGDFITTIHQTTHQIEQTNKRHAAGARLKENGMQHKIIQPEGWARAKGFANGMAYLRRFRLLWL